MKIPLYYIDKSYCLLEVTFHNSNTFWIDWFEIDINGVELIENCNILCIDNNNYCYYNTNEKKIYNFKSTDILTLCVDNIKLMSELNSLNNKYLYVNYLL